MLDPNILRNEPDRVKQYLQNRNYDPKLVDDYLDADNTWRDKLQEIEKLKSKRNDISAQIPKIKAGKEKLLEEAKILSDKVKELEPIVKELEAESREIALKIPNLIDESVIVGCDESFNPVIRTWGTPKSFDFKIKSHDEIGLNLDILDFERGVKISGAGFTLYKGLGASLERALINFMLDTHKTEHGYTEIIPPVIVNNTSMTTTGQLPKFEEDLYKIENDYLIPTAEVPVTNIHRDEIIDINILPIKYCAYTPCFRREAGSYGKDTKGIIRQHQFNKVELVQFVEPKKSMLALGSLTADAEKILQKLNLPYRVVMLCSGDTGFSSSKTYDIEVWLPSQNCYREISSCSNFKDFQARRGNIRMRREQKAKPELLHTLNGSGLAVGRCVAAILENYQNADGSFEIPEVLKEYIK